MKKKWLANLIVTLISTLFALVLVELLLRFMLFSGNDAFESLRNPSAYVVEVDNQFEDFYHEDYWKLIHRFGKGIKNLEDPHPLLGWCGFFNNQTLEHVESEQINGRRPVLLYGDSFAQCVDSVRCFEDFLNHDSLFSANHYFLNYGVGGYGVDQIALLFKETYQKYDNPFIVFSLLTTDMDRCMLEFRDFQKPFFEIENDELVLKGVPIEQSTNEYIEDNPPEIPSYLFRRFRNSKIYPFKTNDEEHQETWVNKTKELNAMILKDVHEELKNSGLDYAFLIFHPEHHGTSDWRINFLREFCNEQNMPCIFEPDIRRKDAEKMEKYNPFRYAIKNDGHPTSYTNKLVAEKIKQEILLRESP